jgi:hypothetical protein
MNTAIDDDEAVKTFRLFIKRRLLRSNKELKLLSKAEMQKALDELYGDELTRFESVRRGKSKIEAMKADLSTVLVVDACVQASKAKVVANCSYFE